MSNLSLTDCNGLTAYSCAAATMDPMLCLQLECLGASAQLPSAQGFTFAQIRGALHRFHHPDLLHLEILFGRQGNSQHGEWFDYWGELLEHGGPEHVALPVDGWWQWCSDWQQANCLGEVKVKQDEDRTSRSSSNNSKATTTTAATTSDTEQAFGILPPLEHCEVWFRLRKRRPLPPEFPDFFAQAIRLISAAETDFYENAGMTVIEPVLNGFKEAISLLMTGIRTCPDCPMKGRAADYLQLAMQRFDSLSELSAAAAAASSQSSSNNNNCLFFASLAGTRAGSTSALPLPAAINTTPGLHVGADPRNASTASLPAVTKTFPLFHRSRSRSGLFSRSANKKTAAAGQDELKFCPVCSERLSSRVEAQRVEHLNACLTKSGGISVLGDRYTVHVAPSPDPRECPICYEEFEAGERVAVMNCLCRFHERCIERWFRRSPTCPFHSE